ncbi:hypothetical protein HDV05_004699 [Chytridiales sp. JEL 0842]|nr:hypothetical protein HDV05_004699 [Chytridiales sp. JEL 0842]
MVQLSKTLALLLTSCLLGTSVAIPVAQEVSAPFADPSATPIIELDPAGNETLAVLDQGRFRGNLRPWANKWGTTGNKYPIVMVHGLMGWGEKPLLNLIKYWGLYSNVVGDLRDMGYQVHVPAMGPVSSNWERACELYAQLVGARVDYGIARANKFGHSRYGQDFTGKALVPGFMSTPTSRIHLIGHSMGGPTSRAFAALMAYGSQEEVDAAIAAGTTVSPLFWTNKTQSYIHSVTGISGVLQGSTVADFIGGVGPFKELVISLVKLVAGVSELTPDLYNFQLDHWGLGRRPQEGFLDYMERLFSSRWAYSKSTSLFDLAVGAQRDPLMSYLKNSRDTTYFSVSTKTTYSIFDKSFAELTTNLVLAPFANLAGSYSNRTLLGNNEESWRPNDGLVPVRSSSGDSSGFNEYNINLFASNSWVARTGGAQVPVKGRYHRLSILERTDHFQVLEGIRKQMYYNLAGLVSSLPA